MGGFDVEARSPLRLGDLARGLAAWGHGRGGSTPSARFQQLGCDRRWGIGTEPAAMKSRFTRERPGVNPQSMKRSRMNPAGPSVGRCSAERSRNAGQRQRDDISEGLEGATAGGGLGLNRRL